MEDVTITLSPEDVELIANTLREAAINKVRESEEHKDAALDCSLRATELTHLANKIRQV